MFRHLLFLLFFISTTYVFSHNNRDFTKELLIQIAQSEESKIDLHKYFPKEKIKLISQSLNIYLVQFTDSIPWSHIEDLKKLKLIVSISKNAPLFTRAKAPNDSFFIYQFQHSNYIHLNAKIPVGIRSIDAWDYTNNGLTTGGDTIVVVIADQGFDKVHEDLDYFVNYREIPNDSIDNDSNGAIDDYRGWNVSQNNSQIDLSSTKHGINAAGIAAAKGNNKIGVAGVAWNVKIMPLADLRLVEDAIAMLDYCYRMKKKYWETNKKQGAYITAINFSLGTEASYPSDYPLWCAAIQKLDEVGILVSIAGANVFGDAYKIGDMPILCNCSNMINVTTFDSTNFKVTSWSYSDKYIHVAAPERGYTTYPNNRYGNAETGTSHATPLVTGTIALMYSQFPKEFLDSIQKNPMRTNALIKSNIIENSDADSNLLGKVYKGKKLTIYKTVKLSSTFLDSIKKNSGGQSQIASTLNVLSKGDLYTFENQLYIKNLLNTQVQIFNLLGEKVFDKRIVHNNELFDVSVWSKGLYLALITSNQEIYHYKFIKE